MQKLLRNPKSAECIQDAGAVSVAVHCGGYSLRSNTGQFRHIHKILALVVEKALNFSLGIGTLPSVRLQLGSWNPSIRAWNIAIAKMGAACYG